MMARNNAELTPNRPRNPPRSDSRATQERLLEATGRLLAQHDSLNFNMADIAREASVSSATVYRYFHSMEEAIGAYMSRFVDDIVSERAARLAAELTGVEALYTLGEDYVRVAARWGPGLIHVRSPRGFLARRRAGDRSIVIVADMVMEAILAATEELEAEHLDMNFALLLWNGMFDPREIFELRQVQKWSAKKVSGRLTSAFIAAICAPAAQRDASAPKKPRKTTQGRAK